MSAPKIKHIKLLPKELIRKRDGATMTHSITLTLTTDEALAISDLFTRSRQKETFGKYKPASMGLIRTALLMISEQGIDEYTLLGEMAKWRTRAALAEKNSISDVDKALHLLAESQKSKLPEPKKERRVFVPEPRRR